MHRMLLERPEYRFWILWLVLAVAILMEKPWGDFGWDEWLAIAAPLLLIHPAIGRIHVLLVGAFAAGLAWFLAGDYSGGWRELSCLVAVLVIGTNVGYRATRENDGSGSYDDPASDEDAREELFFDALNRELCRARRDSSSFIVLSLDLQGERSGNGLHDVFDMLDNELRAYADITQVRGRVLALVPEVGQSQFQPMLARLKHHWKATQVRELRIGYARFPQDAICAEDLVGFADRKRLVRDTSTVAPGAELQPGSQVSA